MAVLLVLSPGPSLAVVTRNAVARGRPGGVSTALGIGVGNSLHALFSALGLSVVLQRSAVAFEVIKVAGAGYLIYLGLQGLWRLTASRLRVVVAEAVQSPLAVRRAGLLTSLREGVLTNLLHPSVALFYLTYLPQFIGPDDPFGRRFALLASVHVGFSVLWMSACAVTIDRLSRVLTTPVFSRAIELIASCALVVLGLSMIIRSR